MQDMKKCLSCRIVLDQPCPNPICPGHHSDSMGDLCQYCATNQRDEWLQNSDSLYCFLSSLGDLDEYVLDDV